jgi:hypothetical protein
MISLSSAIVANLGAVSLGKPLQRIKRPDASLLEVKI